MTNKQIARTLNETALLLELTGGNPFRARAFSSAARTMERLEAPAASLLAAGTLTQVQGIGEGLAAQIRELVESGSFGLRDKLLASIPPGLPGLLRVKGLGVKRVRQLWQELGITSLEALEQAARAGRLAQLEGFGPKMQDKVLENLRLLKKYHAQRRYADALDLVAPLLERLRALEAVERAEPAGELRRKMETVRAAEVIVSTAAPARVRQVLSGWLPKAPAALEEDRADRYVGLLPDDFPLQVHLVPPERFGTAWWQQTGSPAHCEAFRAAYGPPADVAHEHDLYARAGLAFIEPELRENLGELEAARRGTLPTLITAGHLHGTLHNHSTYSDGAHTLQEMAEAARALGFSYFGICDHSRSLTIANGMPVERVRAQQAEVSRLNAAWARDGGPAFRLFSGIESDILADGSLDYPDDVLASFDFVVASVHSGFNMGREVATDRVIRAVENPYTTILGHATGRLLLAREGYPLDHEQVIAACAAHGVAIELNANPYRLDMDWRWIRTATSQGVLIAINPDAHSVDELRNIHWGVQVARKGWLEPAQCLNAKPLAAFTAWLEARRAARAG